MKKYYSILAILAISLVACNKESNSQVSSIHEALVENGLKYIEIAVSQEKPVDPETKATLSDVSMAFGPGDQIAILATKDATTAPVTLTYLRYEDSKVIFGGSVDEEATISPYAYYPASIATSTERVINWPTTIDGSKVQVPMIAYLDKEAGSARFQHLGAIAKIAVANCPVGASKLQFTANTNITGGYTVSDFKTGTPIVSASGELTGATITATIDGNGTYYIPLPVNSSSGTSYANFQFALINSAETYYYKQKTATESFGPFARRNIVNFGTLTYDVDQIEEWYVYGVVNGWSLTNKEVRYIKTGSNTYQIVFYAEKNDGNYLILDKDGNQYVTTNVGYWSDYLKTYTSGAYCACDDDSMNKSVLTTDVNVHVDNSTVSGWDGCISSGSTVELRTNIDAWASGTALHKYDYNNNMCWHGEFHVPDNQEYEFKFVFNNSWWGGSSVELSDSKPYACANGGDNMKFRLTEGDYIIYLDGNAKNFMFVKKPLSE